MISFIFKQLRQERHYVHHIVGFLSTPKSVK